MGMFPSKVETIIPIKQNVPARVERRAKGSRLRVSTSTGRDETTTDDIQNGMIDLKRRVSVCSAQMCSGVGMFHSDPVDGRPGSELVTREQRRQQQISETRDLESETPPEEWKQLRKRWERLHALRVLLNVAGLILLQLGALRGSPMNASPKP